jgi:hypothetical protein
MDYFLPRTTRNSWQRRRDIERYGLQTSRPPPWLLRSDVRGLMSEVRRRVSGLHNPTDGELHLINFYALFT